jgi:hypothetical protein
MSRKHLRGAAIGVLAVALLLGLGSLLAACGSAGSGSQTTASTVSSQPTGTTAPATTAGSANAAPAFSGTTLDGKTVSLEQFRGKPLLLVYMTDT